MYDPLRKNISILEGRKTAWLRKTGKKKPVEYRSIKEAVRVAGI